MEIFTYDFMIRALIGALIVGVAAPSVGVFLVQKRMALIGDGLGHVALTGVALGFLTNTSPLWTTLVVTAFGAVAVEWIRSKGKASGGVFITALVSDKTNASLSEYLFGSLMTTRVIDIWVIGALGAVVVVLMLTLRPWLSAICHDEEHARVSGLPVATLNLLLAVITAVTVSVAMRAVGLLLVSALLVIPVVTAQQVTRGFAVTMYGAMAIGLTTSGAGVITAGLLNVPPGAAVVLMAVGLFVVVAFGRGGVMMLRRKRVTTVGGDG